jgi:hypothetical protein
VADPDHVQALAGKIPPLARRLIAHLSFPGLDEPFQVRQ